MADPYPQVFYRDALVPAAQAALGVATSAVLYGLSVYTVLPVRVDGRCSAFRLPEHYRRLVESCTIIGIDRFAAQWSYDASRRRCSSW
ncbi:hypothetical protein C1Y40_04955 [Mycobacterium talmoniae]|uniref:Uncharacterized protein n=1 Tax=Mycobacterium talmoniae TaxID=1858794 RepID=A0A2S8BDZ9_9MYCO|nr:hypothetical protein C1Y40_04955 [Mycobacterium talmoniae]